MTIIKIWLLINLAFFAWTLSGSANAQQPQPSQTAIQIDNVVNQWAQQLEQDQRVIADLQKQLEEAKKLKEEKPKAH